MKETTTARQIKCSERNPTEAGRYKTALGFLLFENGKWLDTSFGYADMYSVGKRTVEYWEESIPAYILTSDELEELKRVEWNQALEEVAKNAKTKKFGNVSEGVSEYYGIDKDSILKLRK